MDTWKIVVIIALICGLGGYGYYQANAPLPGPEPAEKDPQGAENKRKFQEMKGKPATPWNIETKYWANTAKPITLDDLKGSVTLLEFWRIGCSHCIEAAPYMEKVFETYKKNGLKIVAFQSAGRSADKNDKTENPETNWDKVKEKITELGIKYPVAFDKESKLFRDTYHGTSYPSLILLDSKGTVVDTMMGSPIFNEKSELQFLTSLHQALGLGPWNSPTLLSGKSAPTGNMPPVGVADPHAGHNHAPGEGHGEPAKAAPGHEGHNHGPEVVH